MNLIGYELVKYCGRSLLTPYTGKAKVIFITSTKSYLLVKVENFSIISV
ncbi:hypothetical protein ACF3DV_15140 [Chlorogloeopsis fritschii PCC 9212]|nr:hypothetical protein [Chlorogloeopsis fritschii]